MSEQLTTYAELAEVVDRLGITLRDARRARGLSLRDVATQIGCSFSTVLRAEQGHSLQSDNLAAILRWLDLTTPPTRPDREPRTAADLPREGA